MLASLVPDGRYLTGQSNADGKFQVDLYRTDQEMQVLVAAEGSPALLSNPRENIRDRLRCLRAMQGRQDRQSSVSRAQARYQELQGDSIQTKMVMYTPATLPSTGVWQLLPYICKLGEALHLIEVYGC